MNIRVVALDLERTLIDDAMRGTPRPGLFDFLTYCCGAFERVVLFTTVETSDAREVLSDLNRAGHLPPRLLERLEYIEWSGEHKDLGFVRDASPGEILLIDDDAGWIKPDQRDRWLAISAWDGGPDTELARVQMLLATRLTDQ